jgi:hypothetical protein
VNDEPRKQYLTARILNNGGKDSITALRRIRPPGTNAYQDITAANFVPTSFSAAGRPLERLIVAPLDNGGNWEDRRGGGQGRSRIKGEERGDDANEVREENKFIWYICTIFIYAVPV